MSALFFWEKHHNISLILGRISSGRKAHRGKISFGSRILNTWLPVLLSAIGTAQEVRVYKTRCVKAALFDPSTHLDDQQNFLRRCAGEYQKLNQRPQHHFVLLGDVTYSGERPFSSVRDGICKIEWCKDEKSSFISKAIDARRSIQHRLDALHLQRPSKGLAMVKVFVEAENHGIAFRKAADALDKVRSLINLTINQDRALSPFTALTNKPHAVNVVRQGPYFTMHNLDGSLATETIWYEPRWDHEFKRTRFSNPKALGADVRKWLKRTSESALSEFITQGLLRYCRALDSHDRDTSLLGLWGVIEHLTVTQDAKYDTTVKRLLKIFSDPEEVKEIAEHVRNRRNRMIHASISPESDEADMVVYHADFLATGILVFVLTYGRTFKTKEEIARFLDLPRDPAQLNLQSRLIKRSLAYQRSLQP